jgi:FkbM family methyltransferase
MTGTPGKSDEMRRILPQSHPEFFVGVRRPPNPWRTRRMPLTQSLKNFVQSHDRLNSAVMAVYMRTVHPASIKSLAREKGLSAHFADETIDIRRGSTAVRIGRRHAIYVKDVVDNFDFYYGAVASIGLNGLEMVDYSTPRYHDVLGYDRHPIFFPSLAEPLITTEQYLEFAQVGEGAVALDLGAYSGLTSIMIRERCGPAGRVVAVDADGNNLRAIRKNFALYEQLSGRRVDLVEGAVWTHNDGITFSSEGNMGSSATDFVGDRLGAAKKVPSYTLSAIARRFDLPKVDFIKCDVEGAEAVIFDDKAFFERNRPRIIAEVHQVKGVMTTGALSETLAPYGYRCAEVPQPGSDLPLLECVPTA